VRVAAEGPAQWFSHTQLQDLRTVQGFGDAPPRDFNLGKLGHQTIM
jgi:hypothetical protein